MKVLNFGSLNIDYVYSVAHFVQPGETLSIHDLLINSGGKGLNQSVALSRAGIETWHAGFIGEDGAFLRDELNAYQVHTDYLRTSRQKNGHAIIQVDSSAQNCILVYPGTNGILTMDYVEEVLSHFTSDDVVLLQNETNLVGEIMEAAASRNMRIAFNAAPIREDVKSYPLQKVRWLFVNEIEGGLLSGESTPEKIIQALRSAYPQTEVILTLGKDGCIWAGDHGTEHCSACRVQAVDTTAAGDTFTGFFLRGVLDPVPTMSPLTLATVASAIAVTRAGAAKSVPTIQEVLQSPHRPQS